jgi:hypothetical protein
VDKEIDILRSKLTELEKENEILKSRLIEFQEKKIEISKFKILIVEGNHERDFFKAWLKAIDKDDIQVMPIGGKTRLKNDFVILVKRPNFGDVTSILIIRDADCDPKSAFDSVCNVLRSVRVTDALKNKGIVLKIPENTWTFTKNMTPRVGIAILPAKDQMGALEELLLQTVPDDPMTSKSYQFIDDAIITLNETDYRTPPPFHRLGKARVHAFLATFEEPDRNQGIAAKAGIWDFQHKSLDSLRAILEEL